MGERKVLNKYYPPDFDPVLLPRNRQPKDRQIVVRIMLPFSLQCKSCGEYIHSGKKFNSRKEWSGEDYLGIHIFRFYIKCTACCQEITFKTDPKNFDYVCEGGAQRNFEPWRQEQDAQEAKKVAQDEEEVDAIKALENRMIKSKREMDITDALEEIRDINARNASFTADEFIEKTRERWKQDHVLTRKAEEEADEKLLSSIQFKKSKIVPLMGEKGDGVIVGAQQEEEDNDDIEAQPRDQIEVDEEIVDEEEKEKEEQIKDEKEDVANGSEGNEKNKQQKKNKKRKNIGDDEEEEEEDNKDEQKNVNNKGTIKKISINNDENDKGDNTNTNTNNNNNNNKQEKDKVKNATTLSTNVKNNSNSLLNQKHTNLLFDNNDSNNNNNSTTANTNGNKTNNNSKSSSGNIRIVVKSKTIVNTKNNVVGPIANKPLVQYDDDDDDDD